MKWRPVRLFLGVSVWAAWLAVSDEALAQRIVLRQPPPDQAATPVPSDRAAGDVATTIDALDARLKEIEADTSFDDASKKTLTERYRAAVDDRRRAVELAAQLAELDDALADIPRRAKSIEDELASPEPATEPEVPPGASIAELQQLQAEQAARRNRLAEEKAELDAEPQRRAERKQEIARTLEPSKEHLQDVERRLMSLADREDLAPELAAAEQAALMAREAFLTCSIDLMEREQQYYAASGELLALEQKRVARRLAHADLMIAAWGDVLKRAIAKESAAQAFLASRAIAQAPDAATRALAESNHELAARRTELPEKIGNRAKHVDTLNRALEQLQQTFERDREKVDTAGLTDPVRTLLWRRRAELDRWSAPEGDAFDPVWDELRQTQTELFRLEDDLAPLEEDFDAAVQARVDSPEFAASALPQDEQKEHVAELFEARRQILGGLVADYRTYYESLVDLDTKQQVFRQKRHDYAQYINGLILWIRSGEAVQLATFDDVVKCLAPLADPQEWVILADLAREALVTNPFLAFLGVVLMLVLIRFRGRLRRRVRELGEIAGRRSCAVFRPTLEALGLTVLVAAMWPLFLWFVAWRIAAPFDAYDTRPMAELAQSISAALSTTAAALFLGELLCQICRPMGLAEAHFQWPAKSVASLRRNLRAAMIFGLPLLLLSAGIHAEGSSDAVWRHSVGRLLFLVGTLLLAFFAHRILHPTRGALADYAALNPNGWVARLRYLWYSLGMGALLGLAGLSAAGYHYTADHLAWRIFVTLAIVVSAVLLHAILLRWLLIARRKLAMQQARERRAALAESRQEAAQAGEGEADAPIVVEEPAVDLSMLDEQTRKLINVLVGVLLAATLYVAWVDVMPALGVLNDIKIWPLRYADSLSGGALGSSDEDISLAHLLLCLIAASLTYVAGRNIPGLLEIAVLQRLPMAASARYAVTTVSRYVIVVVGAVIAFGLIGIGWSKVQWLAAAVTVGLGFGLQEIFANFVSGLIILFEQPIRLGDVITVGSTTGTVTRIRMRATTITNWERQELIVPNKDFITGNVVNWTLTDTVQRITINVGVAYGTDTELTRELLLRTARENAIVLKDPEPRATFEAFGDSTLNFTLRAYLPSLDFMLQARHELHAAINRLFLEADIEIAFPQRDLHIRSIEPPLAIVDERRDERKTA